MSLLEGACALRGENRKPQGWKGLAGVGESLCFLEGGAGFPERAAVASLGHGWMVVCPPPPQSPARCYQAPPPALLSELTDGELLVGFADPRWGESCL